MHTLPSLPGEGRVVEGRRKVRMADVGPDRRGRLDALARYLAEVAEDDASGAALPPTIGWVLRRTRLEVDRFPVLGEDLVLRTFCSGIASRWAERTTYVEGSFGAGWRALSIWVAVDTKTGAPARLGERFAAVYGSSAGGRRISARLTLATPGARVARAGRQWPLRRSDLDAWSHVNNAVAWAAVEDAVDLEPADSVVAVVEHHSPIGAETAPVLAVEREAGSWRVWLLGSRDPGDMLVASALEVLRAGAAHTGDPNRHPIG
ncbi:MAG: acyl-ACP thioesterase domain-containing protein [Acidimicrobiales bacterium]